MNSRKSNQTIGIVIFGEVFNLAQAWIADVILRFRLAAKLEATHGGGVWQDWGTDAAGQKKTYAKLIWGIAVPFR